MDYFREHKTGFIGSIITHLVVLLLLLFFGFFTPLPLPGEEGILVNFGDTETGFGAEEPAPSESAPVVDQEEMKVEAKTPPPPPQKKVAPPVEKKELMTQDLEKTVAMESAKKKKEAEKAQDLEKERILKQKLEQERIEKQRQAEADRLRQAEIDRQKREEEQRLAQAAAEKRRVSEINSRAKNAFGGAGQGTSDSKSSGQGVTYGAGNQGSPQGTANAERYGTTGGGVGNGVSYSLDGRSALTLPKPNYPGNDEGVVVVQVTVNKSGQVTKAEAGVRGSNTADPELIAAARKAALQARFNVDDNAPAFQVGTITYRFVLD